MDDGAPKQRRPNRRRGVLRLLARVGAWGLALLMMLTLIARTQAHTGWAMDMVAIVAAQIAAASLVLGLLALCLRLWAPGGVLLGVALIHAVWLSGGRAERVDASAPGLVSVMTFNAYAENERPELVIEAIEEADADIVVIIEAGPALRDLVVASPRLLARYPGHVLPEPRRTWSVLVLSRWPLRELQLRERHPDQWKRWRFNFAFRRSAVIERPEGAFLVSALWPDSPRSAARWREGNHEVREMAAILRECLHPLGYPELVCVDLNATPSGYRTELMRQLSGLRRSKPLAVLRGTWPSPAPPLLRVAIDDVLVSDGVGVASWETLERETGSDHVPVVVRLLIPPPTGPGSTEDPAAMHAEEPGTEP